MYSKTLTFSRNKCINLYKVRLTFICSGHFQAIIPFLAKKQKNNKKKPLLCRMLTGKSRILTATFYSYTVSRSRIRRQCLVELKKNNLFLSVRRKDLVHLRVVPSIKKTKSEYLIGWVSLSALVWADISLLAVSAGPSQIIYKFHAACNCDVGRVPSGLKKYSRETEFSLFNVMDFFSLS